MRYLAQITSMIAPLLALSTHGRISQQQQAQLDGLVSKLPSSDGKTRRSKTKPDRPSKKGNGATMSARTRRRHRRAA